MTAPFDPSWEYLTDPRRADSRTQVYVRVMEPSAPVQTAQDGWRHVLALSQPIALKLVSAPGNSLQFELCGRPRIVVGLAPPTQGDDAQTIVDVLNANGVEARLPD